MRFARQCGFVIIALLSMVNLVSAQDSCSADVNDAIAVLNDTCFAIGRNQVCYGNGDIVVIPASDAVINFAIPGDSAAVSDIDTLNLSPFEADFAEWGVAVLVLQADLPDTLPGQNVTMLLFGDASLSNDGGAYYFTSGIGSPTCNQAPNGMLIQTPEGVGEVKITVNGIEISLGSTAYLATLAEDILTFALLEGNSTLSVEESDIVLEGEQFTTIELDEEGNATGEFSEAEDIADLELPQLPIILLPESPDENDSSPVSGDVIIPASGEWLSTIDLFNFEGNCSVMVDETLIRDMIEGFGFSDTITQVYNFNQDEFDINDVFNTDEFANAGLDFAYDNPEPNVHVLSFSAAETTSVSYTWRIISEDRIEGEIVINLVIPDIVDCIITTTFFTERES